MLKNYSVYCMGVFAFRNEKVSEMSVTVYGCIVRISFIELCLKKDASNRCVIRGRFK